MESTTNPFARLLVFYDATKRSKLNASDLTKIYKKYGSKPEQMAVDVGRKYSDFVFPTEVTLYLLPKNDTRYESAYDIRSPSFNPEECLKMKRIAAVNIHHKLLDNLSKAKCILEEPGRDPHKSIPSKSKATSSSSSKSADNPPSLTRNLSVLDRIAIVSSKEKIVNDAGEVSIADSPLALIHDAMKAKYKIRVMIRRKNSIRGSIVGHVRAFDKHFNMLLTDVDEEYALSQSEEEDGELLSRHLPQLLVRGDNVVLVCRAQRRTKDKMKYSERKNPKHMLRNTLQDELRVDSQLSLAVIAEFRAYISYSIKDICKCSL